MRWPGQPYQSNIRLKVCLHIHGNVGLFSNTEEYMQTHSPPVTTQKYSYNKSACSDCKGGQKLIMLVLRIYTNA